MRVRAITNSLASICLVAAVVTGNIIGMGSQAALAARPTLARQPLAYDASKGQELVQQAKDLAVGKSPWSNGCVPGTIDCIPYSWGGGHGAQPGPSLGTCHRYSGHLPCVAEATYGLDCSGFSRWVYALVYGQDVLGAGNTTSQRTRPHMQKVPHGEQQPGDLAFFPGHVGVYIGEFDDVAQMVNAPQSYDPPTTAKPGWTQAYARIDKVKRGATYYRYTSPNKEVARAVFGGTEKDGSASLWTTNGTEAGTTALKIAGTYPKGFAPRQITAFGAKALFVGVDSDAFYQLWITNGTVAGTQKLTSQTFTEGPGTYGVSPSELAPMGARAVFSGVNELWTTDGTPAGTHQLTGIANAATPLVPSGITPFGAKALFRGTDKNNQLRMWITDGTTKGTYPLAIANGGSPFTPSNATAFGSRALFGGPDKNGRVQLWVTDGTSDGTKQVTTTVTKDGLGVIPMHIVPFGGKALFSGNDADGNVQLWVTDGTAGGTALLKGIAGAPAGGLAPIVGKAFGSKALFSTASSVWISDGTAGGTKKVLDTASGDAAYSFAVAGAKAYFNEGGTTNSGLVWMTDGTPAGTQSVPSITAVNQLVALGGNVLVAGHINPSTVDPIPLQLGIITGTTVKQLTTDTHQLITTKGYGVEPRQITPLAAP